MLYFQHLRYYYSFKLILPLVDLYVIKNDSQIQEKDGHIDPMANSKEVIERKYPGTLFSTTFYCVQWDSMTRYEGVLGR